ncbi:MAG: M23 family metallopeptidase [Chromatiales bacterium]|nr:M23 family metallopeptidase [Gammaproteobacteria bacterium]MBW6476331.1 M23 family metallopeptidase [Chromatiales bacterium]
MNILLVSKRLGGSSCLCLNRGQLLAMALAVVLALPLSGAYIGYQLGKGNGLDADPLLSGALLEELDGQRLRILEAKSIAEDNLNALTLRMGQMQAHVIRLDAMGQRITRIAGLDDGEFDFSNPPAQGGPEEFTGLVHSPVMPDFMTQLNELARQLENREKQLSILENMIMNRNLQAEIIPAGRPLTKGWISSRYGVRNDPFTGKAAFHNGIDLAAREGTDVIAVAAGVVTWAGRRFGYGNLVEINHGNGYVTRYGHLKAILVNAGETIKKGHNIATVGSTGRSTGPHVHFEVWVDGRAVDPMKYVRASN